MPINALRSLRLRNAVSKRWKLIKSSDGRTEALNGWRGWRGVCDPCVPCDATTCYAFGFCLASSHLIEKRVVDPRNYTLRPSCWDMGPGKHKMLLAVFFQGRKYLLFGWGILFY